MLSEHTHVATPRAGVSNEKTSAVTVDAGYRGEITVVADYRGENHRGGRFPSKKYGALS